MPATKNVSEGYRRMRRRLRRSIVAESVSDDRRRSHRTVTFSGLGRRR